MLEGELQTALDKEEILKRAQQHEADLEDQLSGALEDLDRLEVQCEELLAAKKKVDAESETWKAELANAAHFISLLEKDKSKLKDQIYLLEDQLEEASATESSHKADFEAATVELEVLRTQAKEQDDKIHRLEQQLAETEEQLSILTKNSTKNLDTEQSKVKELTAQIQEYRQQLDDQYKASQEYEDVIGRKEHELTKIRTELEMSKQKQIVLIQLSET